MKEKLMKIVIKCEFLSGVFLNTELPRYDMFVEHYPALPRLCQCGDGRQRRLK